MPAFHRRRIEAYVAAMAADAAAAADRWRDGETVDIARWDEVMTLRPKNGVRVTLARRA